MGRRAKSTSSRARACLALLAASAALLPASASAAPAAIDEYALGPAGSRIVERPEATVVIDTQATDSEARVDPGVVGEADPGESPLTAVGAIASPAAWAFAAAALLAAALILLPSRRPTRAAR